ncbi:MAG: hypothetical protein LUG92_05085 [Oscillospiraceae bacterium]|nr:hypothetical protein [Oscillospiraceae bacterium]
MGKAINYLSLARKGGLIEIGETAAGDCVRRGRAKLIIVAADASDNAQKRAGDYAKRIGQGSVRVPYAKEEISKATGRPGCSMAAFTDAGIAAAFMKALAEEYGEEYSAAEAAAAKRDRTNAAAGAARSARERRRN